MLIFENFETLDLLESQPNSNELRPNIVESANDSNKKLCDNKTEESSSTAST